MALACKGYGFEIHVRQHIYGGQTKVIGIDGPADLAYRGIMPAARGRAIRNVDSEREDKDTHLKEFATMFDPAEAAQDAQRREALRRSQLLAITVTTTLVLGLRRLKAELRKAIASASYRVPNPVPNPNVIPAPTTMTSELNCTTKERNYFNYSFRLWAATTGASTIRTLRWIMPSTQVLTTELRSLHLL